MKKILAIDDKRDNLITISALLGNFLTDCTVITAQSGIEGIEKAKREQPDTIILDIKMPQMDGFEVCKHLKDDEVTKHIPIILLTAIKTDMESKLKGLQIGADAFLTKPIDETELIAQINVMLRIKHSEDLIRKEKDLLEEMVNERTRELQESRNKLIKERDFTKSLYDSSPAYYIAINGSGSIMIVGRAMLNALGYTIEELKGQGYISTLVAEGYRSVTEEYIRRLNDDKVQAPFENCMRTREGSDLLVEWHGRAMCKPNGEIDFIYFVGIDITERRRLEKIIMNDNEKERYRIGQNLHDGLGQHLAGIIFKSEIVKIRLEDREAEESMDLDEIISMISQAINQTRDLARGLCPVDRQEGGLVAALEELCESVKAMHGIKCILKKEGEIAIEGNAESSHLYYIAREAVNNAVKHGGAQNIIVALNDQNGMITLEVTDDGVGIDLAHRGRQGTGLSIMQYRAWIIGGALSINRNSGGGTRISCVIKKQEGQSIEDTGENLQRLYTASKGSRDKYGVLVVDDHPIVRQGLTQIINREEDLFVCGEAKNAEDALKMVGQLQPHMLTVDVSLGGTSGIDLIKALKSRYPGLPCLVLSIYDESLYADRAISVGARGYVMKQESPGTIVKAIRTVLQGKQFFSDRVKEKFIDRFQFDAMSGKRISVESLTNREYEVFQYLGQGLGNRHIAEKLNISVKTVENYRERIKNKLNIGSSSDVVQLAVQWMLDHTKVE
ncbi:MAG: response regulator [Spirochaetes bacterium]|nr:response regulator [Spirochaetota bacterium]